VDDVAVTQIRLDLTEHNVPMASQTTITPHNQQPFVTRTYPSESQLDEVIERACDAQKAWRDVPIAERIAIAKKFTVRPHALGQVPLLM
jgi:acyl-CoA reductase-like NAD-dependent aldehyde dehydrogenase